MFMSTGAAKLEFVNGREDKLPKDGGEQREKEATAIHLTLWCMQAEHAAEYLGKGRHESVVRRVRNDQYQYQDSGWIEGPGWPSPLTRSTTSTAKPRAKPAAHAMTQGSHLQQLPVNLPTVARLAANASRRTPEPPSRPVSIGPAFAAPLMFFGAFTMNNV
jgi:hypothetical protein